MCAEQSVYATYKNGVVSYVRVDRPGSCSMRAAGDHSHYIDDWVMTASASVRFQIEVEGAVPDARLLWFHDYWDKAFEEAPDHTHPARKTIKEDRQPDQKIRDFLTGLFPNLVIPQAQSIEADEKFLRILRGDIASNVLDRLKKQAGDVLDGRTGTLLWTSLFTTESDTGTAFGHAYPFGLWVARLSNEFFFKLWMRHHQLDSRFFTPTGKQAWNDWLTRYTGDDFHHATNYWRYTA